MWEWIKTNYKLISLGISSIFASIIGFAWYNKRASYKKLEIELDCLRTKLELEKIAGEYKATLKDLDTLRERETVVDAQIQEIEKDLKERLQGELTPEEIVKKFRELGIHEPTT